MLMSKHDQKQDHEHSYDRFTLNLTCGSLTLSVAGKVAADVDSGRPLDPALLRNFILESPECQTYLKGWNITNLQRLKATVLAYLHTTFPHYTVDKLDTAWLNGPDQLTLTS